VGVYRGRFVRPEEVYLLFAVFAKLVTGALLANPVMLYRDMPKERIRIDENGLVLKTASGVVLSNAPTDVDLRCGVLFVAGEDV
jgi:hypothetical protein